MTTTKQNDDYAVFLNRKTQLGGESGFEPLFMPDKLFPFQRNLTEWALRKGRAAMLCDCGLGKGFMGLTFAQKGGREDVQAGAVSDSFSGRPSNRD